jgi:hypothetical protein
MPKLSYCRSCGSPIIWTVTSKGKAMPVDADPAVAGRGFRLDEHDGEEIAAVFTADPGAGEKLYVNHSQHCSQVGHG